MKNISRRLNSSITFDKSFKTSLLEIFGKSLNEEGLIVEKTTGQIIPSLEGDGVSIRQFAGLVSGSEIYLKSDIISLIKFVEKK